MKFKNNIVAIVPTWNNVDYIDECLNSILIQKVDGERITLIVRDDMSDDGTYDKICSRFGIDGVNNINVSTGNFDVIFIRNIRKMWQAGNIHTSITDYIDNDNAIIFNVDGDDMLIDDDSVFKQIYDIYNNSNYLMVWSQHRRTSGNRGYSAKLPDGDLMYRTRHYWSISHLRTFKVKLYKKINADTLRSSPSEFIETAGDIPIFMAMSEIAGPDRCFFYDKELYIYRDNIATNDHIMKITEQNRWSATLKGLEINKRIEHL